MVNAIQLIVVDEPIDRDRRVLESFPAAGQPYSVVNISDLKQDKAVFDIFTYALLFRSLVVGFKSALRINSRISGLSLFSMTSGMLACYRWSFLSVRNAKKIAKRYRENNLGGIHAHDLYCALAVVLAKPPKSCYLIYDAHEVEINRNRKTGWLRVLVEYGYESWIIGRANEIRVVNRAIALLMAELYCVPIERFKIRYNDFYAHREIMIPHIGDIISIVYVGKAVHGRQLESLDKLSVDFAIEVNVFLMGKELPNTVEAKNWYFGPTDYEQSLCSKVKDKRSFMWCCLDDTSLSYKLATPNKFFQALAIGIPVLASKNTYLAEIVQNFGLGVVFDGKNFSDIIARAKTSEFEQWVENIKSFRAQIRAGRVVI